MQIKQAVTETDIRRCFPVMVQLRPHLTEVEFVERVKRQAEQSGYQLAYVEDQGQVKAVAGFLIREWLAVGRMLYVDDLVTDASERSKGYGRFLFEWLVDTARRNDCQQFHLDSGVQRTGAHRFYMREGMEISAYHFALKLTETGG